MKMPKQLPLIEMLHIML